MTLQSQIKHLRELCEKATPGPWDLDEDHVWREDDERDGNDKRFAGVGPLESCDQCPIGPLTDGQFIATSRNALPELIEKLEKCIQTLELITKCGHPTTCPKKEFEYCESGCEQKTMALETLMEIGAVE